MKISHNNWFVRRYERFEGKPPTNLCGMFWLAILGTLEPVFRVGFPIVVRCAVVAIPTGLAYVMYSAFVGGQLLAAIGGLVIVAMVVAAIVALVAGTVCGVGFLGRQLGRTESGRVVIEYAKAGKRGICPLIEVVE